MNTQINQEQLDYQDYVQAKIDLGEEPMTFEQWKIAESELNENNHPVS